MAITPTAFFTISRLYQNSCKQNHGTTIDKNYALKIFHESEIIPSKDDY